MGMSGREPSPYRSPLLLQRSCHLFREREVLGFGKAHCALAYDTLAMRLSIGSFLALGLRHNRIWEQVNYCIVSRKRVGLGLVASLTLALS